MAFAIWYLIGAERGLDPDPEYAAVTLDNHIMEELSETLLQGEADEDDVATVLGLIGAAQRLSAASIRNYFSGWNDAKRHAAAQ